MKVYSPSVSTPRPGPGIGNGPDRTDASRPPLPRADGARSAGTARWQFFRSIFQSAPEPIAMLDAALRVVVWNTAAATLSGHGDAEILGRRCRFDGITITLDLTADPDADGARAPQPSSSSRFLLRAATGAWGPKPATVIPLPHDGSTLLILPRPPDRTRRSRAPRRPGGGARPAPALRRLTEREHEILKLMAAGKTAKAIATHLSLSLPTVRSHTQHILRKVGVHSALEAVVWFLRAADGGARS